MSLVRIALRIAAVEALKGRTLVGNNVLDSPNGALDVQADGSMRTDEEKPFISVFTPLGKAENITGRSLIENGVIEIAFEIGMSMAMFELNNDTGESTIVGIQVPVTDSTTEFFLDIVQRQIGNALTDPANEWAEIYRGLHYDVRKVDYVGARSDDDGQRLAGHQMIVTMMSADDPVAGQPLDPESPLAMFLAKCEASGNPIYVAQAAVMRAELVGGTEDWQVLQRRHGMTAAELLALGRGPMHPDQPNFSHVAIEVDKGPTIEVP